MPYASTGDARTIARETGFAPGAHIHRGALLHIMDQEPVLRAMAWGVGWGVMFGGEYAAVGYRCSAGARDLTARCMAASGRFEARAVAEVVGWVHPHHAAAPDDRIRPEREGTS